MKKIFKTLLFSLFLFIIFTLGNKVEANSISKISMDIYVDVNGNAQITEIWNCKTSQGTEVYHPYYNLGNSKIENLTVSEGDILYETLSSWETSGTLSSKAYTCGINYISDGVELCWGISTYDSHTYTVKYTITNFVSELSDSQMIYWTLIPHDFSNSIGNVYIKIHTDFDISDSTDVWGYGNTGTAYVYDGYIEMQSDGKLPASDYMTILAKFPLGTFQTTNRLDNNFEHYYELAKKGTTDRLQSDLESMVDILIFILFVVLSTFTFIIICHVSTKTKYDFGPGGKSIPKNVDYFRDIPCQGDLFRAYYIGYKYGMIKNKTDILGAIILRWLKKGFIKVEQRDSETSSKKENTVVVFNYSARLTFADSDEEELFALLSSTSKDGILNASDFENWGSKYSLSILVWFDDILKREEEKLIREGKIIVETKKNLKLLTQTIYRFMPELKQEAINLAGLKRYLLDYSFIQQREAMEVHLFEEYLIYAQMLGIANATAKQFEDLYPEVLEQSHYTSYHNIMFLHTCASSSISHAYSAKARAQNYSSGGGGFSSSGGGGSSFGGGGGGGGFR